MPATITFPNAADGIFDQALRPSRAAPRAGPAATGIDVDELARALDRDSGLLALAGTPNMRAVLAGSGAGQPAARLAFDVYVHRLRAGVAAMAAAMNGLDALVFTGGVGERAPVVRATAAEGLGFLGVKVDPQVNHRTDGDTEIRAPAAAVRTLVINAREDLEIARQVREVLGAT